MKPQWQQQQEQMRQQQQQRMQMGWWQQQQDKKQKEQHKAQQQKTAAPLTSGRFAQVEREVARLRQDMAAGRLTQAQLDARLRELMVQDERGVWWMISAQTGVWHRHDGSAWVQANPYRQAAPPLAGGLPTGSATVSPRPQRLMALATFVVGLAITLVFGFIVGSVIDSMFYDAGAVPLIIALVVWLTGLVMSFRYARKLWRGW